MFRVESGNQKMIKERNVIALAGLTIIAVLAACGGGGGGGSSSVPGTGGGSSQATPTPGNVTGQGTVRFSISIPARTGSSTQRRAQFVDPNTESITLTLLQTNGAAVSSAAQGPFNLTAGSPGCTTTGALVCTFSISAPVGNDVFLANTYSGTNATGPLGSGAVALSVVQNATNTANLTLTGPISNVVAVSNNGANLDTLWNGVAPFVPITATDLENEGQVGAHARNGGQTQGGSRIRDSLSTPAPVPSARLFLIAEDSTGNIILNPTTYNQPIILTLSLLGGPANVMLSDTPPSGLGCAAASSTSTDGRTVSVCSPADVVTISLIPTVPSPQIFDDFSGTWINANAATVTTSLASPLPAGFTPVTFGFVAEVVPTPLPTATGQLQVIGQ
jgi:hypothetical protein